LKLQFTTKKATYSLFLLLFIVGIVVVFVPIQVPYNIKTKAVLRPLQEWSLIQSSDGKLSRTLRDYSLNTIQSLGISEFQRGDVVSFHLKQGLTFHSLIKAGDTIGFIYSNEEQRKLLEIENDLAVLNAEYLFHTSGQKAEDIEKARREVLLAQQEFQTEEKRYTRFAALFDEGVIATQEFEWMQNSLQVKKLALSVAEATLASLSTGDKQEQAQWTLKKMEALQAQIAMMKERLGFLTLSSPIQGIIASQTFAQHETEGERLLTISNADTLLGLAPIKVKEKEIIKRGDKVLVKSIKKKGTIVQIDNTAIGDWMGSAVYVRFLLSDCPELLPGEVVDIEIIGQKVTLWEYLFLITQNM